MKALRQHLLHAIDEVLARPEVSQNQRQEAVSLKKLLKGDGSSKVILGWVVDTVRQTIELPAHRKAELAEIFEGLKGLKRMGHKRWKRTLGKLRFVSTATPGFAGLFSALQLALTARMATVCESPKPSAPTSTRSLRSRPASVKGPLTWPK